MEVNDRITQINFEGKSFLFRVLFLNKEKDNFRVPFLAMRILFVVCLWDGFDLQTLDPLFYTQHGNNLITKLSSAMSMIILVT